MIGSYGREKVGNYGRIVGFKLSFRFYNIFPLDVLSAVITVFREDYSVYSEGLFLV